LYPLFVPIRLKNRAGGGFVAGPFSTFPP